MWEIHDLPSRGIERRNDQPKTYEPINCVCCAHVLHKSKYMTMQRSIAIGRKSGVLRECLRDQVANHISSNAPGQRDESGLGGFSDALARHGYG